MPLPTDEAGWKDETARVTRAMLAHAAPYVTPISRVVSHDFGKLQGTGSYIEACGQGLFLTNDHNFLYENKRLTPDRLGVQLWDNPQYFRLHNTATMFPYPLDCAFTLIDRKWAADKALQSNQAKSLPESRIALAHTPVPRELLFFKGYAGEGEKFMFNKLIVQSRSYTMQERPTFPNGYGDPRFHFALDYAPDKATELDPGHGLPVPKGFSGSLVWNTRYVEAGGAWMPEDAVATGIVWGWVSDEACLLATRIEYVRSFLARSLCEVWSDGKL
jgi:hypothetical protein